MNVLLKMSSDRYGLNVDVYEDGQLVGSRLLGLHQVPSIQVGGPEGDVITFEGTSMLWADFVQWFKAGARS